MAIDILKYEAHVCLKGECGTGSDEALGLQGWATDVPAHEADNEKLTPPL